MRHYVEKTIPSRKEKVLDKITCDLCGKVAEEGRWDNSVWRVNNTAIQITVLWKKGESYPESGYGTEYMVDICPDCFKNKLIPWFESQGCRAKRKEWYW